MKNFLFISLFLIILSILFTEQSQATLLQQDIVDPGAELQTFSAQSGYDTTNTPLVVRVGDVIQIILGFVGTLFLILIIVSGFQWMTAGGNSETIGKAKQRIINATIGLVIVLAAYSITWFVTTQMLEVTGMVETTE